jgi:protein-L-isoaspartate O-methyltransferase
MQNVAADRANQEMVDSLIVDGSLWSPSLIAAFRATPRHRFVDRVFQSQARTGRWREIITRDPGPREIELVYSDRALVTRLGRSEETREEVPISSSSQPSLMAQMLEDLYLTPGLRVLEIGAGTGYNAALMAHVVGPDRVTSIDVDRSVLSEAWDHLRAFPERCITLRHTDGRTDNLGPERVDRLAVTAATPDLEPTWLDKLTDGGMLSAPIVLAPGLSFVLVGTVRHGVFEGRLRRGASFMPLRSEGEPGERNDQESMVPTSGRRLPAPWATWLDRKQARPGWFHFCQALAFYGWLRGLTVFFGTIEDAPSEYGVADGPDGAICWFGPQEWRVNEPSAADLGRGLWRAFLEAGGPWPTEFQLRAAAEALPLTGRREEYVRNGPVCQRTWALIEPRERPS